MRDSGKRILFICGMEGAPFRYRVQWPAEALALFNVDCRACFYTDPELEKYAAQAEVVIIHRVRATKRLLMLIKAWQRRNVPVLFDADDLVFDSEITAEIPLLRLLPRHRAKEWLRDVDYQRTTIQECNGFIGSTQPLCEYANKLLGIPTARFPNGVGARLAHLSERALGLPRLPGPLRLGYLSGTRTHDFDWFHIEPAVLAALARHKEVELWLIGQVPQMPKLEHLGPRIKRLPMQAWQHLPGLIRQLDVNLAPLAPDSCFNEAKSAIKWLEAGLVGTATLASSTQPFREAIRHRVNGLLAEDLDAWQKGLNELLDDDDLRLRVGSQARRDALERWSPEMQGRRYVELLDWAAQLPSLEPGAFRGIRPPHLLDEEARPHPLEPSDMTLMLARTQRRVPTTEITADAPLEFDLPAKGKRQMRLDLLCATFGGGGVPIKVTLFDQQTMVELASASAPATAIAEEAWAAFHFQLPEYAGSLRVRVARLPTPESKTHRPGRIDRLALWAELYGSHLSGGMRRSGIPCVRLWVEENGMSVASSEDVRPGSLLSLVRARARFAYYALRVNGPGALARKAGNFALLQIDRIRQRIRRAKD